MSVTNQTPVNAFTANGVTTVFNFTFQVLDSSDLKVQVDGQDKIIGAEYTVSGVGNPAGGSVTFMSAPASAASVVVFRDSALERDTDYQNNGDLRADTINADLDRIWLALQDILYGVQLAPTIRPGSPLAGAITLPDPGAGKFLRWNLAGNALEAVDGTGTVPGDYIPSGTGAVARQIQIKISDIVSPADYSTNANYMAACSAQKTGQMMAQNGARIWRMSDRIMLGDAVDSDCSFPNVAKDWLTTFQEAHGLAAGTILNSQFASLTNTSAASAVAGLFGARSANFNSASTSCISMTSIAVNDHASLATRAWAGYFEAHKVGPNATGARGIEIDVSVWNGGTEINPTPAAQTMTSCLQLGAGCGVSGIGQSNVGAAIQIVDNPMKFRKGIVFLKDSLDGTDGTSGQATAMAMASFQALDWFNAAGAISARINVTNTNTTNATELRFANLGIQLYGKNNVMFQAVSLDSAVNYLQASPNTTGGAPFLQSSGTDTDIDLRFIPKGAGLVRFGAWTTNADAAVNGYVTIKDSGGTSRKLATIA